MKYGLASKTAELSAMIRAVATRNKLGKSIFNDPYSKLFIGKRTSVIYYYNLVLSFINPHFWNTGMNSVGYLLSLCRHRFIYDKLIHAMKSGTSQFIFIGAGYDTTYLNLKNSITSQTFIELDFPATQKRKKKILSRNGFETPNLMFNEIDLKKESVKDVLKAEHLDYNKETFIVIEGVLSYLMKNEIEQLINELSALFVNSIIIADYRMHGLEEKKNLLAAQWLSTFSKYNERYVSFFSTDEIEILIKNSGFKLVKNIDLLDLWINNNELRPNKKLQNFGGLFIAENENKINKQGISNN